MLPQEAIEEFKALYLQKFGVELSTQETRKKAQGLYNFIKMVCREIPKISKEKQGYED